MTGFTPGPWVWEQVKGENSIREHTLKGPDVLCRYWFDAPPTPDALVIAAAPDLLAACKGARLLPRPWIDGGVTFNDWLAAIDALEAAIAKAEGQ